jgi:uncharacterized Zn-finger protein
MMKDKKVLIRISKETWKKIHNIRLERELRTIDDVIRFLIQTYQEHSSLTREPQEVSQKLNEEMTTKEVISEPIVEQHVEQSVERLQESLQKATVVQATVQPVIPSHKWYICNNLECPGKKLGKPTVWMDDPPTPDFKCPYCGTPLIVRE